MAVRSREARKSRTIQRIRFLLLVVLMATVAGVVYLLVRGPVDEGEQAPPSRPVDTGGLDTARDLVTTGEGFERTVSEGNRSLFTVRGETYSVDQEGVVALEGVEITIYGEEGAAGETRTTYELAAPEASFEQERKQARLSGGVVLTGEDGLRLETAELNLVQRGRQVISSGDVYIRFGDRLHARADRLRVLLRAGRYNLLGHARVASLEGAERPFELTARRLTLDRTRHLIEAEEGPVRLKHLDDWVVSDRLIVYFDEAEERLQYLRARNWLVAELRSAEALGQVPAEGESGADSADPAPPRAPSDAELDPEGFGLAESRVEVPGMEELSRLRIHAESLDLEMTPDGRHPVEMRLDGGPRGVASVRSFAADAAAEAPVYHLVAPRIDGRFRAGRPHTFEAAEPVRVAVLEDPDAVEREMEAELETWWQVVSGARAPASEESAADPTGWPGEGAPARRGRGRRAEARFDDAGVLDTLTLIDDVVILDGATRAEGARGIFRAADDVARVTGAPATVVTPRVEMEAPSIEYDRTEGILHGTGGVRARLEREEGDDGPAGGDPAAAFRGTPLGGGDGPIWVEAEQGFFRESPRSFLFTGSVRAWKGQNLLTGSRLRGDDAGGRLAAAGDVRTLWIPSPEEPGDAEEPGKAKGEGEGKEEEAGAAGGSGPSAADGPIEVTSDAMDYRRGESVLVYTGSVVAEQADRILRCREMEMHLASGDGEADGDRLERLICTGDVRMSEAGGGRTLQGHRAVYEPGARTVDVTGAPDGGQVVMEDPEGNVLEGPRMIYEIELDRVRVLALEQDAGEEPENQEPGDREPAGGDGDDAKTPNGPDGGSPPGPGEAPDPEGAGEDT